MAYAVNSGPQLHWNWTMIIQFQCDVADPSRMNVRSSGVYRKPVTSKPASALNTSGEIVGKANFFSCEAYHELMGA